MIQIKCLKKVYQDNNVTTHALKDLSFNLPDKGFVFIVGKSGSGKSTLINMIGGLDDATSGEVIVDGFNITKAKTHELDIYRNNYLGIIYQNYNLFNDETVIGNVRYALNGSKTGNTEKEICKLLDYLDLTEKRDVLVKNLSGGQKQRVAIARALINKPKLILADEPTGNLDNKTAKIIFDYLKEASKNCLVLLITHDIFSAIQYADRIIEISDGQKVNDVTRKESTCTNLRPVELIEGQNLTKEEKEKLNNLLFKHEFELVDKNKNFATTEADELTVEKSLELKKQKNNHFFKYGLKTLLRNKLSMIITSLMCVLMVSLMAVATSLANFKGDQAIKDVTSRFDIKNLVIRKGFSNSGKTTEVEQNLFVKTNAEDENKLSNARYKGNKYPIYVLDNVVHEYQYSVRGTGSVKYENFYCEGILGVVGVNENFLHTLFGNYEVIAGSIEDTLTSGKVIITDYIADSFLFYNDKLRCLDENTPYINIVNKDIYHRTNIGAIIKTGYKEKYKDFLDILTKIKLEPHNAESLRKQIINSDLYTSFLCDVDSYLNYGYTLDPDYFSHVNNTYDHLILNNCEIGIPSLCQTIDLDDYAYDLDLAGVSYLSGNSALMNIVEYNKYFGKNLKNSLDPNFEPEEIILSRKNPEKPEKNEKLESIPLHIIGVFETESMGRILLTSNEMKTAHIGWNVFQYGWMFDEVSQCYELYQNTYEHYYFNKVVCFDVIFKTIGIINVFSDVFGIIIFGLLIILGLVITMGNLKIIKTETYRIGVLKSMGYSSLFLAISILMVDVASALFVLAFSSLFGFLFSLGANKLIQTGFVTFSKNNVYNYITMVSLNYLHILLYSLAVLLIVILTSFIPFLIVKRIKPSRIIRNAE